MKHKDAGGMLRPFHRHDLGDGGTPIRVFSRFGNKLLYPTQPNHCTYADNGGIIGCTTKGWVAIRSNTTDSAGTPCLKTVCMSPEDALKNVGRGVYELYQLARDTQTGALRDHVELGAAAQPDCPGWVGGTGIQLIFECVAVEMGWTTKEEAQVKVIQTLRGLNGKLPGYTMVTKTHTHFNPLSALFG